MVDEAPIEPPALLAYVWEWFAELLGRRTSNGVGPNPMTYQEVEAWARLTGRTVTPYEVRLLMRLDDTLISTATEAK